MFDNGDCLSGANNFMIDDQIEAVDSLKGWVAVGFAFASMFICFGVVYSFGAFFDSMASEFKAGSSATSAVFSITTFIFLTGGIVSGMVADRIGARPVLIFGGISLGLGLYLTSLVNSLWVTYITFGVGVGVGVMAKMGFCRGVRKPAKIALGSDRAVTSQVSGRSLPMRTA